MQSVFVSSKELFYVFVYRVYLSCMLISFSDRLADGLCAKLLFLLLSNNFISYLPFLFFFSLSYTQIASLSYTHTHTLSHLLFLPGTYCFTLSPFMFDQSPCLSLPVATGRADGVKTIFCESERCWVFPISYSWALLAQVCGPGLVCSGDAVADWIWINESVTFNTGWWCHQEKGRGGREIELLFISSVD